MDWIYEELIYLRQIINQYSDQFGAQYILGYEAALNDIRKAADKVHDEVTKRLKEGIK